MTRIAHVVENLDVGGLERVVITLMEASDAARYQPVLYTLGEGGHLAGQVEQKGYPVRRLNKRAGRDYGLLGRLARQFRADSIDVVHCHNSSPLVYGSIAGRMARVGGVVYTAHGARTAGRRITRWFQHLRLVDDVVFVSRDAQEVALAARAVITRGIHTIVNGVRVADYVRTRVERNRMRALLGIAVDAPVAGIVARLTPAKDHDNLINAFKIVQDRIPSAQCVIVGDGELMADIKSRVFAHGLSDNVHLTGRRDDVAAVLAAFDVYVLSSYTEGLAVTLLEAMAAALPIVATRVGGNGEVVRDGETGFLVPPRDPGALADAITTLLENEGLRGRMAAAGRARCGEEFSDHAMARKYQQIYDRLAKKGE